MVTAERLHDTQIRLGLCFVALVAHLHLDVEVISCYAAGARRVPKRQPSLEAVS